MKDLDDLNRTNEEQLNNYREQDTQSTREPQVSTAYHK